MLTGKPGAQRGAAGITRPGLRGILVAHRRTRRAPTGAVARATRRGRPGRRGGVEPSDTARRGGVLIMSARRRARIAGVSRCGAAATPHVGSGNAVVAVAVGNSVVSVSGCNDLVQEDLQWLQSV